MYISVTMETHRQIRAVFGVNLQDWDVCLFAVSCWRIEIPDDFQTGHLAEIR